MRFSKSGCYEKPYMLIGHIKLTGSKHSPKGNHIKINHLERGKPVKWRP